MLALCQHVLDLDYSHDQTIEREGEELTVHWVSLWARGKGLA